MKIPNTLHVTNRDKWRAWLKRNHLTEKEVWLICYKKRTGQRGIPYEDAVEEALCFGWIDSIVKRVDDDKYARKFTPRKKNSKWSELNKRRVAKVMSERRMTPAGLAKISYQVSENVEDAAKTVAKKKDLGVPDYVEHALKANTGVWENFNHLAPSYRRNHLGWITSAKQQATRERRLREAIGLLAQNKKMGLK